MSLENDNAVFRSLPFFAILYIYSYTCRPSLIRIENKRNIYFQNKTCEMKQRSRTKIHDEELTGKCVIFS